MKKRNPTKTAFKLTKTILGLGTMATGFMLAWKTLAGVWIGVKIIASIASLFALYVVLDSGIDKSTDFARALNGQDKHYVPIQLKVLYIILFVIGLGGSVATSVIAVDSIVESASGIQEKGEKVNREIQSEINKENKRYNELIKIAETDLQRATAAVATAQSVYDAAEDKALRQIGGQFEELWRKSNSWVRTARQFRTQRNRLEEAKLDAKKDLDDAKNNLKIAQKNKAEIVASANKTGSGTVATKSLEEMLENDIETVRLMASIVKWSQPISAVLLIFCLITLYYEKDVPDEKTMLEVIVHYLDSIGVITLNLAEKPIEYLEKKTKLTNDPKSNQQQMRPAPPQQRPQMPNPAYQNINPLSGTTNTAKIGFINYDDNKHETTATASYPTVTDNVTLKEGVTHNVTHNNQVTHNKISVTNNKLSVTDKQKIGVGVVRKCVVCGTGIDNKREDARTCSASCRQALKRRLKESAKKLHF